MKKLFLLFIFLSFLFSCTNEEDVITSVDNNVVQSSNIRTYDEALKIAKDAVGMLDGSYITRAALPKRVVDEDDCVILRNKKTRSSGNLLDTLMYIFNYADNAGFAIVSANKATEGLLAVSDSGNISSVDNIQNPGLSLFVDMAQDYVSSVNVLSRITPLLPKHVKFESDTISENVPPRVEVAWSQDYNLGQFCPNELVGCGPLAIIQAMSYFEHPTHVEYSYEGCDVEESYIFWLNLKQHTSPSCDFCYAGKHKDLARLCRQIGELCNADYTNSSQTPTTHEALMSTLTFYGYTVGQYSSYSSQCVRRNLGNNIIIMVGGDVEGKLHSWIVDGYIYTKYSNRMYDSYDEITWNLIDSFEEEYMYNHFNWGYGGLGNGYFSDGVFSAGHGYSYDGSVMSDTTFSSYPYNVKYFTMYH